ncbi:MAG: siphovirus Gp157 family protein [Aeromonadaceae bacterium]
MKLHEISEQLRQLSEMDEIPPEQLQDTLDMISDDFRIKAENVAIVIREIEAQSAALKAEADRMTDRKKSLDSKAESLKDYLRFNMEATGIVKVSGKLLSITLGAPSEIVVVPEDALDLPDDFQNHSVTANKAMIKSALKAGQEIKGCAIMNGKAKLTIK